MKPAMAARFRIITVCLFLLVLTFFILSCHKKRNPVDAQDPYENEQEEEPETSEDTLWTFLFYEDADFTPSMKPLLNFATKVRSGENANFIVLQDTDDGPANMWYIDENHNIVLLQEMGEINMGSSETLYDFLMYGKTHYPADRFILSFYDHGHAWEGACDDVTSSDTLTMDEMQRALIDAGGVDFVLFSAPCLMGALESVYELRNCTDIYFGSENFSGYFAWMDAMRDISETLHNNPGISNHQFADSIIVFILQQRNSDWWQDYWSQDLTMSGIRTDMISDLKDAVEAVALAYLDAPDVFRSHTEAVYSSVSKFKDRYLDVYDLAEKLLTVEEDGGRRMLLENVKQCLQNAVIAECHGTSWPNVHGLTIYIPDKSRVSFDTRYRSRNYGLDFSNDTHWDELIQGYVGKSKPIFDVTVKRPQSRGDKFVNFDMNDGN